MTAMPDTLRHVSPSVLVPVLAALLTGCGSPATACPAIMYGASLTVRLADDWPTGAAESATVRCPEGGQCGLILPSDVTVLPEPEEVPVPSPQTAQPPTPERSPGNSGMAQVFDGGAQRWSLYGAHEELVVSVSGAGGVLTAATVRPDWVRVGGTEDCGGPAAAEVVVPAP